MRRINTAHSRKKKQKRQNMILGIALIIVMFGSVFGMVVGSFGQSKNNSNSLEYNGFEFFEQNGFWFLVHERGTFVFKNNPKEVLDISQKLSSLDSYYEKSLYISSNFNEATSEIYGNLFQQNKIVQRVQFACLKGDKCEGDLPTKDCENNFIILRESSISKIYQDKSCVFIEGKKEDLVKLVDEFLFNILGIK